MPNPRFAAMVQDAARPPPGYSMMKGAAPPQPRSYQPMQVFAAQPRSYQPPQVFSAQQAQQAQQAQPEAPEGAWRCPLCENVNYGNRVVCNTRKCRLPRPVDEGLVDAEELGAPRLGLRGNPLFSHVLAKVQAPLLFAQPAHPSPDGLADGTEWSCLECGNVNYGFRDICNTRKCRASKPA